MDSKWMKRSTLFQPSFKAFYFANIDKKVNIRPEPENKIGRGSDFMNL